MGARQAVRGLAGPGVPDSVTLRALAYLLGLEPGAAEGTLQRALAWCARVLAMPRKRRHEEPDSVPYGVRLFLRDAGWGAWAV